MIEVNVITVDNVRKPDYEGSYVLIEDKGDTMMIKVEQKTGEEVAMLKLRLNESEDMTMFLMDLIMNGGM